jgi:hypothetical protein
MGLRLALACAACATSLWGCGAGAGLPAEGDGGEPQITVVAVQPVAYATVRSDGAAKPLLQVGDEGASQLSDRAIVRFSLAGFPNARHIVAARLWMESRGVLDDFDQSLGLIGVLRIDAGTGVEGGDFGIAGLTEILDAAPPPPYGFALVLEVTQALVQALDRGADHLDLRLQAQALADGDDAQDMLHLEHRSFPELGLYGPELVVTGQR